MKKKLLVAVLTAIALLTCAIGLSACNFNIGGSTSSKDIIDDGGKTETDKKPDVEEIKGTDGLKYELSTDGTYYICAGKGTATETEIVIASTYNGKPVKEIANNAFQNSSLTNVTISNNVMSIGERAFNDCSSLERVTIPNSVTSIGDSAFNGCSVLQYNVYENVSYLGNKEKPYLVLIRAKSQNITSCTINTNTKFICREAFFGCSKLTGSIEIPNSVTSIGQGAFYSCSQLTSVTIGDSVTSIGGNAFSNCSSLVSVAMGDSVTSIGDRAFEGCSKLASINIPNSVTSIGNYAFSSCSSLNTIDYKGTKSQWNAIGKGVSWENNVPSTCKVVCTDGEIAIADA